MLGLEADPPRALVSTQRLSEDPFAERRGDDVRPKAQGIGFSVFF